jgi:hypothetical protein
MKMHHLAKMLTAYQQKFDIESKTMAREIGIGESTLARIRQGKLPDAQGLAKIIIWLMEK